MINKEQVGTGKVKFLDAKNKTAIISPEDGGDDVYFDIKDKILIHTLREGQTVQFVSEKTDTGVVAKEVFPVESTTRSAQQRRR